MRWIENTLIFVNLLYSIFTVVPVWDFNKSSIDLLSSSSSHTFTVDGENCQIEKKIIKNENGSISFEKY